MIYPNDTISNINTQLQLYNAQHDDNANIIFYRDDNNIGALLIGSLRAIYTIIDDVVNCAKECKYNLPPNIPYLQFDYNDDHNQILHCEDIFKTIEFINAHRNNGYNVLVHCYAGISRSSSFVIAYMFSCVDKYDWLEKNKELLLKSSHKTFTELTISILKLYRPCINPNINFFTQLVKYEDILLPKTINKSFYLI